MKQYSLQHDYWLIAASLYNLSRQIGVAKSWTYPIFICSQMDNSSELAFIHVMSQNDSYQYIYMSPWCVLNYIG